MKSLFSIILLFCFSLAIHAGTTQATVTVTSNITREDQDGSRFVTFTATVSGSTGTPTGSVVFALNGQNQPAVNLSAAGSASFSTTLNSGEYTITAQYAGDATYSAANGSTTLSLPKFSFNARFVPFPNIIYGQDGGGTLVLSITVGGITFHSPASPFSIYVDGVFLETRGPLGGTTVTVPMPSVGSHTITYVIPETTNFNALTTGGTFFVSKGFVDGSISASRTTVLYGQGIDITATFTPHTPSPGPVTGTITFQVSNGQQSTVNIVNGMATYSLTSLQPGKYTVIAQYSGDQNFFSQATPDAVFFNARCGVVLVNPIENFTEMGGTKTVSVSGPSECNWQASSDSNWLGASAGGSTLTYTAQPLTNTSERSGKLTIDGVQYTVVQKGTTSPLSSATYATGGVAPEQIVTSFGAGLADSATAAESLPLPTTLAGIQIKVRDSQNVERLAPLFYVSSTQVNYLIPTGTATGNATISFYKNGQLVSSATTTIKAFSPGIYTATQNGLGAAAALTQTIKADGTQVYQGTSQYDPAQQTYSTIPIDLGDGTEMVYLLLFGTGLRGITSANVVTATVGAKPVEVTYAGSQLQYEGLDQINIKLPFSLAGNGLSDVKVFIDGVPLNTVQVRIK